MLAVMDLSLRKEASAMPARKIRTGLIALQLFVAVNAVAGSVYLFGGAPDWPRKWLDSTPFDSWLIPGLILLGAVGGSMVAAVWTMWRRPESGASASLLAGLVLLVWITVETAMLGYISWMQPATLAAALLVLALALRLRPRASTLRLRGSVAA
jgi:peptidoglycan/LPS O-acetylase OafA/YrhL